MARAAVALAALLCALAAASAAAASAASAPTAQLVIVGATGDLSKKYLWQSAFNIWSSTGGRLHVFAAARHGETPSIVSEIVHSNVSCISGSASAASAEACARSVDRFLQNHVSAFAVSGDEGWAALGAAMRAQVRGCLCVRVRRLCPATHPCPCATAPRFVASPRPVAHPAGGDGAAPRGPHGHPAAVLRGGGRPAGAGPAWQQWQ